MKRIFVTYAVISLALALILFLLPPVFGATPAAAETAAAPAAPAAREAAESESPAPDWELTAASAPTEAAPFDCAYPVAATLKGTVCELDLRSYLIGVVAAEIPASFADEALKAQAVAARTYTLYKVGREYSANHPETPVCDDISCCKAHADEAELREKWGADYEVNLARIAAAVDATDGVIMTYEAQPILAAFHSSSAGRTAASAEVWGGELPYLVSVESPEDETAVPNYLSAVSFTPDEFRTLVLARFPAAKLEGTPGEWVQILSLTESGRVGTLSIGGVETTGAAARSLFSLRSAAFTVTEDAAGVTFTTAGYGHGVGMSQYGANTLAGQGWTYDEILVFYYPETEPTRLLQD